ncbi:hypothetical protein WJX72_008905 [[Myrmecia] bisecta]|uniref:Protein kinase domain-containing protein n=1 Tax=[Myrmecia] bisecta TaxID=41462 RepID=A0AAW1PQM2_9CHLO
MGRGVCPFDQNRGVGCFPGCAPAASAALDSCEAASKQELPLSNNVSANMFVTFHQLMECSVSARPGPLESYLHAAPAPAPVPAPAPTHIGRGPVGTSKQGLGGAAIAGVVVGVLAGLALLALAMVGLLWRRRHVRADPASLKKWQKQPSDVEDSAQEVEAGLGKPAADVHQPDVDAKVSKQVCFVPPAHVPPGEDAWEAAEKGWARLAAAHSAVLLPGGAPAEDGEGCAAAQRGSQEGTGSSHQAEDAETMLVTEYLSGGTLYEAISNDADGDFLWYKRGHRVALDIARGLAFMHSMVPKIIHFDLKSPNILLTANGTAKIADVGLSQLMLNCTHLSNLPFRGTFEWAAPELVRGERCTEAVDIVALGVLLWELITGLAPSRGPLRPVKVPEECPAEVWLTRHLRDELMGKIPSRLDL